MLKTLSHAAICLALLALLPSLAVAEDESEKDLKKMAGDWVPVLMHLNGKKQPDKVAKAIRLTVSGDKYNTVVGEEKDEGTLKLDATKTPREMDITPSVGENKGKILPCIYELKGNELKVCYGLDGTGRPANFDAGKDGDGVIMLITYKRVPKSKR
jgi:uncharacterized protein (TIGR03067 family)